LAHFLIRTEASYFCCCSWLHLECLRFNQTLF
jgi:hypothetical protein